MNTSRLLLLVIMCFHLTHISGQTTRHVLFLGNSYTASYNLPQMVSDAALSAGDTMIYDHNMPGGYTLEMHATNATTGTKIAQGGWDYVVLQEQSQRPSFPLAQVMAEVFPFASQLNQQIKQHNPCSETMFFMTWGRKNGDAMNCAVWPPVCTYAGMDSLLHLRYMMLADSNQGVVSPVGALWRYIRWAHPEIELYSPDESHPSFEGSYAAACAFYTVIFRKDPSSITWNGSLDTKLADNIRQAAKAVVFDSLAHWRIGLYDPVASFQFSNTTGATVTFTNLSLHASQYHWDFGDGNTSQLQHPVHQYNSNGQYAVTLISIHCDKRDTLIQTVNITGVGIEKASPRHEVILYPNPATGMVNILPSPDNPIQRVTLQSTNGINLQTFEHHNSTPLHINLSHFPAGIYLVRIETKHWVAVHRVILLRP